MPSGKILIVDDNKSILSALEFLLQDEFSLLKTLSSPNQIPSFAARKKILIWYC